MTIHENLQKLRKRNSLNQEQMAEKIGMSKNGYGKLERGESRITIEHLEQIANTFNIDITELLKEDRDFSFWIGDNNQNCANRNFGDLKEIEKLQLIITHKDEIIAQKDKQIMLLEQLLANANQAKP